MKLNRVFEQVLKEAGVLYFREDPDSYEAYRTIEEGPDVEVGCSAEENGRHYDFVWQRSKSNDNLINHKFTHYLTRWAYTDEYRIIDGQKRGNKTISIKTDEGNIGMLCALSLERFGYKDNEREIPEEVLLLIRQEKTQNGKIRLISCYDTNKSAYINLYVDNFIDRQRFGTKRPDLLDNTDKTLKNVTERRKSTILIEQAIERNRKFYIEHFKKGYQIFQKIITE